MNTVDTARPAIINLLVKHNVKVDGNASDLVTELEALISSLTNEAELRGRQSELDLLKEAMRDPETKQWRADRALDQIAHREAALLKLSKGAQDE